MINILDFNNIIILIGTCVNISGRLCVFYGDYESILCFYCCSREILKWNGNTVCMNYKLWTYYRYFQKIVSTYFTVEIKIP